MFCEAFTDFLLLKQSVKIQTQKKLFNKKYTIQTLTWGGFNIIIWNSRRNERIKKPIVNVNNHSDDDATKCHPQPGSSGFHFNVAPIPCPTQKILNKFNTNM